MRSKISQSAAGFVYVVAFILALASQASAVPEVEPNTSCLGPQNLGAITLPFTVNGNLESRPNLPDLDFFKFTGTPGALLIVDLEGQATNQGTLGDPFLGLFSSSCARVDVNDDGGEGLNSRLAFQVPADGIVILGVTSCCDDQFVGTDQSGSYRLTIRAAGRIRGTIADGLGNPLSPLDFIGSFTPSGELSSAQATAELVDGKLTYELTVASGQHRVVAQSGVSRVWYLGKPSFLQADSIAVGPNQTVSGVDFVLSPSVQIVPLANGTAFVTGDTLILNLGVTNLGLAPASVTVVVSKQVPGEPGLDPNFCCLFSYASLFEGSKVQIPGGTAMVLPAVLVHTFTASDPAGRWSICALVSQQGRNSNRCANFSVNAPIVPAGDGASTKGMKTGLPPDLLPRPAWLP